MLASSRKPRAAANTPGRIWNPPLRSTVGAQPIPGGRNHPADRRAGCLIPPHPAPPQCSAGGPWPSPTNRGKHGGPAGNCKPCVTCNPCRGRCSHRPGNPAPPQTSNFEIAAVRRAKSPALRNGENGAANRATATLRYPHPCRGRFHIGPVCGGAGVRRRDKSRPYESILRFRPFGTTATARATVGRDALIPPHPAPPQCSAGNMAALRENTNPAANRHPPVGAHIVRPGDHSGMPLLSNVSPP